MDPNILEQIKSGDTKSLLSQGLNNLVQSNGNGSESPAAQAPAIPPPTAPATDAPSEKKVEARADETTTTSGTTGKEAKVEAPVKVEAPGTQQKQEATTTTAATETTPTPPAQSPQQTAPQAASEGQRQEPDLEKEELKRRLNQIEADRQRAELQQLSSRQQQELRERAEAVQQLESSIPILERQLRIMLENEGAEVLNTPEYAEAHAAWQAAQRSLSVQKYDLQQTANRYQNEHKARITSDHERALDTTLKSAGLDLEAVKAADPKVDIHNPYAVIQTALKARDAKHAAEIERIKAEADAKVKAAEAAAEEARQNWTLNSPAAQPDRTSQGGVGTQDVFSLIRGKSATDLIAAGMAQKTNKK